MLAYSRTACRSQPRPAIAVVTGIRTPTDGAIRLALAARDEARLDFALANSISSIFSAKSIQINLGRMECR